MYIGNVYTDRDLPSDLDFSTAEYIVRKCCTEFEGQYANKLPSDETTTSTHSHELTHSDKF